MLRPWKLADAHVRVAAGVDPDILAYTSIESNTSLHRAEQWIEKSVEEFHAGESAHFAVVQSQSQATCGSMGFVSINWKHARAEIGYWMLPRYRKQGISTRALKLLVNWGFAQLSFARLELLAHLDNVASQRLARKEQFQEEGILRSYINGYRGREDVYIFSRLRGE